MTRADYRRQKAASMAEAAARRRAEFEEILATREFATLPPQEFGRRLQGLLEEGRRQALALEGQMPLGRAYAKAAALLGDASLGSVCCAAIPDLAGTRVIARGVCPAGEIADAIAQEMRWLGRETSTWRDARYEVAERRFALDDREKLAPAPDGTPGVLITGAPFKGETVGTTAIILARESVDALRGRGMTPHQRVWPALWKGLCFVGQREGLEAAHGVPLDEILALPAPAEDDPDQHEALLSTVRYMTALYGEQYATRALCGK